MVAATGYCGDVEAEIFNADLWAMPIAESLALVRSRYESWWHRHLVIFELGAQAPPSGRPPAVAGAPAVEGGRLTLRLPSTLRARHRLRPSTCALALLGALSQAGAGGHPLVALCRDRPSATAYRALATMRTRVVSQDADGSYRLGPAAVGLGASYFGPSSLAQLLHPALLVLARDLDERAPGVLNGDRVIYVDKVEPGEGYPGLVTGRTQRPPRPPRSDGRSWRTGASRTTSWTPSSAPDDPALLRRGQSRTPGGAVTRPSLKRTNPASRACIRSC